MRVMLRDKELTIQTETATRSSPCPKGIEPNDRYVTVKARMRLQLEAREKERQFTNAEAI